jgi:cytochrome c553
MIMRTHRRPLAIATLWLLPSIAMAAAPNGAGDAARGAKAAVPCQACHGLKGEGSTATGSPRLAGQDAYYLDKQLRDYATGLRTDPVMSPMAKTLSDQQRVDVAVYLASLSPPAAGPVANGDAKLLNRGRLLSRTGDESKQLQACGNCHGPDGRGEKFAAPYLDGQLGGYLAKSIAAWKAGTRKNDGGEIMASVAARLDDQDIAAISAYFSGLSSPQP